MKKIALAVASAVILSMPLTVTFAAGSSDWELLTKQEVMDIFTNSRITGRTDRGAYTINYGSVTGCRKLTAGGGYKKFGYMTFNEDGSYTIIQEHKTDEYRGVEAKGKKYRWAEDQTNFKVKMLKAKKTKKVSKQIAKVFPEQCTTK